MTVHKTLLYISTCHIYVQVMLEIVGVSSIRNQPIIFF